MLEDDDDDENKQKLSSDLNQCHRLGQTVGSRRFHHLLSPEDQATDRLQEEY